MKWTKFDDEDYSKLEEKKAYIVYDIVTGDVEITNGYIYEDIGEDGEEEVGWCWWLKDMEYVTHYTKLTLPKIKTHESENKA